MVKLGDASFFAHRSDYRRCGQIGKGVFGEVFRAEVLKHGREGQEVALKQLDLKVRGAAKLSRRRRWSFQSYSYEKSKCSLACDTRTSSDLRKLLSTHQVSSTIKGFLRRRSLRRRLPLPRVRADAI